MHRIIHDGCQFLPSPPVPNNLTPSPQPTPSPQHWQSHEVVTMVTNVKRISKGKKKD